MPLSRAIVAMSLAAVTLMLFTMSATMVRAQQSDDTLGDPERGRVVYRSVGYCVECHGWPGDGITGLGLQAPPGPNLRETELDTETLTEIIGCGIPGTPMPYHDRAAYRDDRCYGLVMSDFDAETKPVRGRVFSERDVANVVAYLETYVIGRGEPTLEECGEFFENPSAAACRRLK